MYTECRVRNIYGGNYSGCTRHCREAARALVIEDGKLLLSHEVNIEQWMLPGGGIEAGETPEDACIRETAEETGLVVRPENCFLTINEFYEDWKYVSYFFACKVVGRTERKPTRREMEVGASPEWLELSRAMDIFSGYQEYAGTNEERRGIYLREYTALTEAMEERNEQ